MVTCGGQKQDQEPDQDQRPDQDQKPISGCCCCFVFRLYEGEALTRTGTRWCHQHTSEHSLEGCSVCAVSHQRSKASDQGVGWLAHPFTPDPYALPDRSDRDRRLCLASFTGQVQQMIQQRTQ